MSHLRDTFELTNRNANAGGSLESVHNNRKLAQEQRDRAGLMRVGKVPVLKRSYNFLSITGFTCTVLVTWESSLGAMNLGLTNGGRAGMIYMFLVAWVGASCTFASLSELASMAPVSAGQYFWVAMLAPRPYRKLLSYLTGWMTVVAWQALVASAAFVNGTQLQALIVLGNPSYNYTTWQGTLIIWAVILFAVFVNTVARRLLPSLEGLILVIHVLGFFGVLVPLVVLSDHVSSREVWLTFYNGGGWPTQGLSTVIGVLMSIFLFTGVDGAVHMAEEIQNAAIVVPNSIMVSMVLNGALGLAIIVAFAYATLDVEAALNSTVGESYYAFIYIYQQGVGSTAGVIGVDAFLIFMGLWSTTANMASASRMLWAFCRDQAVPGWAFFIKLNDRTNLPIRCVALTVTVSALLALINIGSSTALNDLFGVVTSSYFASYLMATGLLFWHRCAGTIQSAEDESTSDELVNTVGKRLVWGPWHIPGAFGFIVNGIACAYLAFGFFWSFWPSVNPVTPFTMNWNCVIFGAVAILALSYYLIIAKRHYVGPIVEVQDTTVDQHVEVELTGRK